MRTPILFRSCGVRGFARDGLWLATLLSLACSCQGRILDETTTGEIVTTSTSPAGSPAKNRHRGAGYAPDCNDPDAHSAPCIDPSESIKADLRASGYPYYVGHAEPAAKFYSSAPGSANNLQWRFRLPATDPTPTQSGSSVASFELFDAFWFSLAMCDPTSFPYNPCTPDSDANDPLTAGSALLEVQFYPPGSGNGCSTTQWCAQLTIDSLHENNPTVKANCFEPVTGAYLTTNGTRNGPRVLMSRGDDIVLTIKDTANGLSVAVIDNTSGATGSMVASAANQFFHNVNTTDCTTELFTFHPEYSTASFTHLVPWTTLGAGVAIAMEIGHWELCGDAACNTKPDGNDEGRCSTTTSTECAASADCPAGETCVPGCSVATRRGIGGCTNSDVDRDGVSYQANWADGTSSHPASIIIGSPNNKGIGPQSVSPTNPSVYSTGYNGMKFKTTESTVGVAFYPFYSRSGSGSGCRLNFGNDIPGVTKSDFGKAAQYTAPYPGVIPNPCSPDLAWLVAMRSVER